jgi:hypothetical protein
MWYTDPERVIRKPVWSISERDAVSLGSIEKTLDRSAPEINAPISIDDLMRVLNEYFPASYSAIDLSDEAISTDKKFDCFIKSGTRTLENWLSVSLKELGLSYSIHGGALHISTQYADENVTRIYPHPVIAGSELRETIVAHCNSDEWMDMGGTATYSLIETPVQSLIVISASYPTHRKVERLLEPLYESCGIGWRTDGERWTQLPKAILNRVTKFINPTPSAPNPAMPGGMQMKGFVVGAPF